MRGASGWIASAVPPTRTYRTERNASVVSIADSLSGAIIRAEGIERVRLSLDRSGQTLAGDLQTSGSYDGSPSPLMITARRLVLHRGPVALTFVRPRFSSACNGRWRFYGPPSTRPTIS